MIFERDLRTNFLLVFWQLFLVAALLFGGQSAVGEVTGQQPEGPASENSARHENQPGSLQSGPRRVLEKGSFCGDLELNPQEFADVMTGKKKEGQQVSLVTVHCGVLLILQESVPYSINPAQVSSEKHQQHEEKLAEGPARKRTSF